MNGTNREKTSTMPKPKSGEVWLVRFPFTDLTTTKVRPALVVAAHGDDIIVTGIFSRVPSTRRATWILIEDQHKEFGQTGLKKSSILKTEKIAVIHETVFHKRLGSLPPDLIAKSNEALKRALLLK